MNKIIWPPSTQLAPVPPVLVACGGFDDFKRNIITIAWTGIACSAPPMISVAIRPERFSYDIIRRSGEFTVNIPTAGMARAVDWCGVNSGRNCDKFEASDLHPLPASRIKSPIIAECPLALECKVHSVIELGVHHLFLADIVALQVSEEFIDADGRLDLEKDGLLAYVHGHYFALGDCIGHFGFSVRKKDGPIVRRKK